MRLPSPYALASDLTITRLTDLPTPFLGYEWRSRAV